MLPEYEYSSILNIHLWLKKNSFTEKFYGLIDSKFHWVFNHGKHITLMTSAAEDFIGLNDEQILETALDELKEFFKNFESNNISQHLILHEKRATFKPSVVNTIARKSIPINLGNIFFAGDWTNTNLPATIEGAVKSAEFVADKIS